MIRFTTAAILFLASASLVRAQEPPRQPDPVKAKAVDAYVERVMKSRHIPGVSITVLKGGVIVLAKGYGLANVELAVPATQDTVYQLASVTKTFTATAIMLLIRDDKLTLDDRIAERLPDLPAAWDKVTVRQLLNHTSGIKSYTSVRDFEKTVRKDYARREILDLVAKEPLEFTPGEKWNYSNTGYFLLGMLIEKVAGKPYGEVMDERIFKPLEMTRTRTNDLRAVIRDRAQGYEWDGKELRNGEYTSPTQPFAAGMLVSTVGDLAKWDAALANHTLLDESTLAKMWTPTRLGKGEAGYGFGWGVSKVAGHRLVSHGGGIPGFSTEISRFIDDKLTVIVLTNLEGGQAESIARGIAGCFVPALAEKASEPIADNDKPTTKRLRGMVEAALKGEADPRLFTEESGKVLVPRIKELKRGLAPLGDLKSFQLVERKEGGQGVHLRYRAGFAGAALKVLFVLDKSGKIAGVLLQPED
jgi:CubicO group peptidase (beta-lactamase class C family)